MSRNSYTVHEGDRIWPLVEIIRNTWVDDLTEDRIRQLVATVDSWRITDADGRVIKRG